MDKICIGIDMGGTLTKIAYKHNNKIKYKITPSNNLDNLINWINKFDNPTISVSGGKSKKLQEKLSYNIKIIDEFNSTTTGAKYLIEKSNLIAGKNFILTNIGTGTSIYYVDHHSHRFIGGTGVGGGLFIGLSYWLTGETDYQKLIKMSEMGVRSKVDLTVGEIYENSSSPIESSIVASNFGKIEPTHPDNTVAAISGLLSDTVVNISCQAAKRFNVDSIVYIGSILSSNSTLRKSIKKHTELGRENAYFLNKGEFSGALGALIEGEI
jgi:type II pantothenate kinase